MIPPRVVHTQDVGNGTTWLIDIFGPPRIDFSSKPGFVLNALKIIQCPRHDKYRALETTYF